MIYLALILNLISGVFVWFFLGDLAFKVSPFDALAVFTLLFINIITKQIVLLGDKNEKS